MTIKKILNKKSGNLIGGNQENIFRGQLKEIGITVEALKNEFNENIQPLLASLPGSLGGVVASTKSDDVDPLKNGLDGSQIYVDARATELDATKLLHDGVKRLAVKDSILALDRKLSAQLATLKSTVEGLDLTSEGAAAYDDTELRNWIRKLAGNTVSDLAVGESYNPALFNGAPAKDATLSLNQRDIALRNVVGIEALSQSTTDISSLFSTTFNLQDCSDIILALKALDTAIQGVGGTATLQTAYAGDETINISETVDGISTPVKIVGTNERVSLSVRGITEINGDAEVYVGPATDSAFGGFNLEGKLSIHGDITAEGKPKPETNALKISQLVSLLNGGGDFPIAATLLELGRVDEENSYSYCTVAAGRDSVTNKPDWSIGRLEGGEDIEVSFGFDTRIDAGSNVVSIRGTTVETYVNDTHKSVLSASGLTVTGSLTVAGDGYFDRVTVEEEVSTTALQANSAVIGLTGGSGADVLTINGSSDVAQDGMDLIRFDLFGTTDVLGTGFKTNTGLLDENKVNTLPGTTIDLSSITLNRRAPYKRFPGFTEAQFTGNGVVQKGVDSKLTPHSLYMDNIVKAYCQLKVKLQNKTPGTGTYTSSLIDWSEWSESIETTIVHLIGRRFNIGNISYRERYNEGLQKTQGTIYVTLDKIAGPISGFAPLPLCTTYNIAGSLGGLDGISGISKGYTYVDGKEEMNFDFYYTPNSGNANLSHVSLNMIAL